MSQAGSTADLLATTGRVTTQYRFGGDRILMLGPRGYCTPRVYLDGFPMSLGDTPLEAIAPLEVVEAAEVYRSASEAPVRYGGGMQGCGVIVLWSKTR